MFSSCILFTLVHYTSFTSVKCVVNLCTISYNTLNTYTCAGRLSCQHLLAYHHIELGGHCLQGVWGDKISTEIARCADYTEERPVQGPVVLNLGGRESWKAAQGK